MLYGLKNVASYKRYNRNATQDFGRLNLWRPKSGRPRAAAIASGRSPVLQICGKDNKSALILFNLWINGGLIVARGLMDRYNSEMDDCRHGRCGR